MNGIKDEWTTEDGSIRLLLGDCLESLRTLPDECVNCCVTSPPYWGLRDYKVDGQIGLEKTPEEYVARIVDVFREVRRVLRDDGTLWLNLGDSYAGSWGNYGGRNRGSGTQRDIINGSSVPNPAYDGRERDRPPTASVPGLKPKDLVGIPWRVAFALQADGWYLRQDIIWAKPNPMPESVTDRCTKSHEYIFLLSKSARYFYDAEAVAEAAANGTDLGLLRGVRDVGKTDGVAWHAPSIAKRQAAGIDSRTAGNGKRNRRSVWTVSTKPYEGAHFATFPTDLIEPCVLAGCPEGGTVLDPFNGSGTTGEVALKHGRRYVGCELNPDYVALSLKRIRGELDKTALIEAPRKLVQLSLIGE